MSKDESIVKSFRTTEEQFSAANNIFRKEGFSLSEVIRLLFDATIREGRIPRGLSMKSMEDQSDVAKVREDFVDGILSMAIPAKKVDGSSAEERLLKCLFGPDTANEMSNASLREWGAKWGLPDNLQISTLADLHDCGFFADDPWFGDYDFEVKEDDLEDLLVLQRFRENIHDNLKQVCREMEIKSVNFLMSYNYGGNANEEQ